MLIVGFNLLVGFVYSIEFITFVGEVNVQDTIIHQQSEPAISFRAIPNH